MDIPGGILGSKEGKVVGCISIHDDFTVHKRRPLLPHNNLVSLAISTTRIESGSLFIGTSPDEYERYENNSRSFLPRISSMDKYLPQAHPPLANVMSHLAYRYFTAPLHNEYVHKVLLDLICSKLPLSGSDARVPLSRPKNVLRMLQAAYAWSLPRYI